MVTTPNMGLVLPDEGGSLNVWGAILDTIFGATKIDGHDHSTGKGVKVPSSGLNINADLTWATHAATDLLAIDFTPSASTLMTGFAGALFVSDGTGGLSANELYWRTTGGTNVKVTAGAALNVAAFTGGIGGDYAATGALVVFDDATDSYWFQQQIGAAVRQYARMRSADVDLYEYKAQPAAGVPTNRVRLASPVALAASYAMTMPAALPAGTQILTISTAGVVSDDGILGSNQNITLSGTGVLKHGTQTLQIPWSAFQPLGNATPPVLGYQGGTGILGVNGTPISANCPIILPQGKRITAVRVFCTDNATGPTKIQANLITLSSAGVTANVGSSAISAGTGAVQTLTMSGLTITISTGLFYDITITTTTGAAISNVYGAEVDYDHP